MDKKDVRDAATHVAGTKSKPRPVPEEPAKEAAK